jgi:WD40 repeat protein
MSNAKTPLTTLKVEKKVVGKHQSKYVTCTSISWNSLGTILYAGFTDGNIRVWKIISKNN